MALILKTTIQIEDDASLIHVVDTTAEYSTTNTGGYGTPNADRNDFAGVLYADYVASSGTATEVNYTTSNVDYNATHANDYQSRFSITYGADGWYRFYYFLVSATVSVTEGDVYYDTGDSTIKKVVSGSPQNITDFSTLIGESSVQQVLNEQLLFSKLTIRQNQLLELFVRCQCRLCDDFSCGCEDEQSAYQKLRYLLAGTDYTFAADKKVIAQDMIEKLISIYL